MLLRPLLKTWRGRRLGKQTIFLPRPSERCRIWPRDVSIKIGHTANIQPERMAARLPQQGDENGRTRPSVCPSSVDLLGDWMRVVGRNRRKGQNPGPVEPLHRGQTLF